jgi:hypothetical protein
MLHRDLIERGATPEPKDVDIRFAPMMHQCLMVHAAARPSSSQLVAFIGALLQYDCEVCGSVFPFTQGVLCIREVAFLCNSCLGAAMESALKTDAAWCPGGSLAWNDDVVELCKMRSAVGGDLFERWQAAQLRGNERQVRDRLRAEMDEERRRCQAWGWYIKQLQHDSYHFASVCVSALHLAWKWASAIRGRCWRTD